MRRTLRATQKQFRLLLFWENRSDPVFFCSDLLHQVAHHACIGRAQVLLAEVVTVPGIISSHTQLHTLSKDWPWFIGFLQCLSMLLTISCSSPRLASLPQEPLPQLDPRRAACAATCLGPDHGNDFVESVKRVFTDTKATMYNVLFLPPQAPFLWPCNLSTAWVVWQVTQL